jgi:hypothetical protein
MRECQPAAAGLKPFIQGVRRRLQDRRHVARSNVMARLECRYPDRNWLNADSMLSAPENSGTVEIDRFIKVVLWIWFRAVGTLTAF